MRCTFDTPNATTMPYTMKLSTALTTLTADVDLINKIVDLARSMSDDTNTITRVEVVDAIDEWIACARKYAANTIEDDDIDIDFALRDVTHIVDMWKIRNALAAMINTLATFVIDD